MAASSPQPPKPDTIKPLISEEALELRKIRTILCGPDFHPEAGLISRFLYAEKNIRRIMGIQAAELGILLAAVIGMLLQRK